ncbi:DUF6461 domain-containing protein [Actinomadura sp. 7K534]|uniref:DUF6461 domain-containing protein n=1 Tax=Actinomadura sp. 7K534 TaxID=2530366 RepID=UPI001049507B|nr:DUF6461 domain-containing protein [Actinomadura sp. 7K534]TDB88248.1 hypothetical protein E1266_31550 [Actinomadura sp. 7K534]
MTVTAIDYQWINDYSELADAYCALLARGLSVQDYLRGMHATPCGTVSGYADLERRSSDVWREHPGQQYLIAATTLPGDQGEWLLGLEVNGFLGTIPHLVEPLSRGTRLVSHFCNVNAVDRFLWYEDGEARTSFEPLFPTGLNDSPPDDSPPDGFMELMEEVGFDLREENDEYERDFSMTTEATFALAERLTGVHLTPELLDKATFVTGLVPHSAAHGPG